VTEKAGLNGTDYVDRSSSFWRDLLGNLENKWMWEALKKLRCKASLVLKNWIDF
jgi:hypothetical protein